MKQKLEQKLKEIFDLEQVKKFVEEDIAYADEWIEEEPGELRRTIVVETLIDGRHGPDIPDMVMELFGRAEERELKTIEAFYDAVEQLECEINECLNELLPSEGRYYVGYSDYDGSYCLCYEETCRKLSYQIIEDKGGTIHLVVFDDADACIYYANGLEHWSAADVRDTIEALEHGGDPVRDDWESNLPDGYTPQQLYDRLTSCRYGWEIIADDAGMYPERMGAAGCKAFGIDD